MQTLYVAVDSASGAWSAVNRTGGWKGKMSVKQRTGESRQGKPVCELESKLTSNYHSASYISDVFDLQEKLGPSLCC
jgi:hypothetical protein